MEKLIRVLTNKWAQRVTFALFFLTLGVSVYAWQEWLWDDGATTIFIYASTLCAMLSFVVMNIQAAASWHSRKLREERRAGRD